MNFITNRTFYTPPRGHLYFSVSDDSQQINEIYYSDLDGSNHFVLLNKSSDSNDGAYQSLQFVRPSEKLYFFNNRGIWFVDIRDGKPQLIYASRYSQEISAITVYENYVYFTDNSDHSIQRCSFNECKSSTLIRKSSSKYCTAKKKKICPLL